METQITETAAEKVYQNHLILDEIYFWLEETADMIGCAMLCRYGVEAAAKRLYEKVPIDLPMRLYDAGCPFNRIFTYWQAVSSVQAGDVWPDDSPIARLAKQFPRLSYIYFRVPESEVHGRIGRVGRNINNDFKEMAIAFPDLEETPAQTLFDQGFSLRGQEAKFYLVDIHIGETRRPSQRIRYRYPFEVFDGREDEEVVDQGFVPVSIKVLLGRMRSFFAYSGSVAPGAMAELLDAMPNLCAFAIRMTSVEQQSGSQEDQEMEETVRAAVSGMPPTLEYLDIQESAYSSHSHIHPFYTTTASPLQTLYLATEMEPYAIHIKTALLLSYLKEGPRPGIRYQGMLRASCIHVSYHADEDGLPKPSYSRTRSSRHSGRVYTSRCR